MTQRIEVVDAQVHLNQITPDWRSVSQDDLVNMSIQAMNAVGVDCVLVGEVNESILRDRRNSGSGGDSSPRMYPFSERAVEMYPERFAYHTVVDFFDPKIDQWMEDVQRRPGANSIRIVPIPQSGDVDRLERGEYSELFAAAERYGIPVFAWVPGRAQLLVQYIRKYPKLQFIIDHCGVGVAPLRSGNLPPTMATSLTASRKMRVKELSSVCDLATYPNVALKWCHGPGLLSDEKYPYEDVLPLLREAIDAFGPERIMWASDYTIAREHNGDTWAECLYYLLNSRQLSPSEKEWILAGAARQVLRWPRGN